MGNYSDYLKQTYGNSKGGSNTTPATTNSNTSKNMYSDYLKQTYGSKTNEIPSLASYTGGNALKTSMVKKYASASQNASETPKIDLAPTNAIPTEKVTNETMFNGFSMDDVRTALGENLVSVGDANYGATKQAYLDVNKRMKDAGVNVNDAEKWLEEVYYAPKYQKEADALTESNPLLSGIQNTASALVLNPIESTINTADRIQSAIKGTPMEERTSATQEMRNQASKNMSNKGKFIYGVANSVGDMGVALATAVATGGGSLVSSGLMGIEKASEVMDDAVRRGVTPGKVILEGALSGATTFVTEKIPMDKILKLYSGEMAESGIKAIAKEIAKSAFSEGSQEFIESVSDNIVDRIVAGDKSSIKLEASELEKNGVEPSKALGQAYWNALKNAALEGVAGALSGGILAGANAMVGAKPTTNVANETETSIPKQVRNEQLPAILPNQEAEIMAQTVGNTTTTRTPLPTPWNRSNRVIDNLLHDKEAKARFEKMYGVELKGTMSQQTKIVKDALAPKQNTVAETVPSLNAEPAVNASENVTENVTENIPSVTNDGIVRYERKKGEKGKTLPFNLGITEEVNTNVPQNAEPNVESGTNASDNVTQNVSRNTSEDAEINMSDEAMGIYAEKRENKLNNLDDAKYQAENKLVDTINNAKGMSLRDKQKSLKLVTDMVKSVENLKSTSDYKTQADAVNTFDKRLASLKKQLKKDKSFDDAILKQIRSEVHNAQKESLSLAGFTPKGEQYKTNQFYTNTLPRSGVASDVEIAENIDVDDNRHIVMKLEEAQQKASERALSDTEKVADRLLKSKEVSAQNVLDMYATAEVLEKGDARKYQLLNKISQRSSVAGQILRAVKEMSKNTPEGRYAEILSYIMQKTDEMHYEGYSFTVDKVIDSVKDIINTAKTPTEMMDKLTGLLSMNLQFFAGDVDIPTAQGSKRVRNADEIISKLEKLAKEIETQRDIEEGTGFNTEERSKLAKEAERMLRDEYGLPILDDSIREDIFNICDEASGYEVGSDEYKELLSKAAKIADRAMPGNVGNAVRTFMYDSMLAGLKTMITRNFGGNAINNLSDFIERPLTVLTDKVTSGLTNQRSRMFTKDGLKTYAEGVKKGFSDQVSDIKNKTQTTRSGENSFADYVDAIHTEYKWKNPISKMFKAYDDSVKNIMKFGDRPFYEGAYAFRKNELQQIVNQYGEMGLAVNSKMLPSDIGKNVDTLIEFLARESALEACMQNNSLTTKSFANIKKGLSQFSKATFGVDILSQSAMPFVQVSGNQFERTMQHTPIGIVSNVIKTVTEVSKGNFDQTRFSQETARNISGMLLLMGAVALAKAGFVSGAYSDDPDEKKAQQAAGFQEYALQLGNGIQVDLSNAGHLGAVIEGGKAFAEAREDGQGILPSLLNTSNQMAQSAFSDSALYGLDSVTKLSGESNSYNQDLAGWGDVVVQTGYNLLGQFNPQIIRQIANYGDEYKRDLGQYGTAEYTLNSIKNGIPGLRQTLPIKYDNEGNPVKNPQGGNIARAFLLPFNVTEPQYSDLTQEAMRLREAIPTSEQKTISTFVPSITNNALDGLKGYTPSENPAEDLREYKIDVGQLRTEMGEALLKSDFYDTLTDAQKDELMGKFYSAAQAYEKKVITREGKTEKEIERLEENNEIYETTDKLVTAYENGGASYMIDYAKVDNWLGKEYSFTAKNVALAMSKVLDGYSDSKKGKFICDFISENSLNNETKRMKNIGNYAGIYKYYLQKAQESEREAQKDKNKVVPGLTK